MRAAPTLDEFKAEVKDAFKAWWQTLDDRTVSRYLDSEEAMFEIRHRYEVTLREYSNGETTYDQFMIGAAGSVGQCLALMY